MTQSNDLVARAERARLSFMSDEGLEAAVTVARGFMHVGEEAFVAYVQVALVNTPGGIGDEPVEAVARAIYYLAKHGIPRGLPSAD